MLYYLWTFATLFVDIFRYIRGYIHAKVPSPGIVPKDGTFAFILKRNLYAERLPTISKITIKKKKQVSIKRFIKRNLADVGKAQ